MLYSRVFCESWATHCLFIKVRGLTNFLGQILVNTIDGFNNIAV